jgi:hypothetical protein
MVWTIPLSEVAGVLAVSFTPGVPVMLAPDTPVQRPGQSAPRTTEPKTEPTTSAPPTEEPAPPELPPDEVVDPSDPTAGPAPAPAPTPFDPPPAPQATDDETAPSTSDDEKETAKKRGPDRVLMPTDRRRFFHMSAGGASSNGVYQYYGAGPMDFQIEGMIGSHTKMFPNFGGAFVMQYRKGFTTELSFAGRLVWDKPLSKAFAIYSSTDFTFGLNVPIGRAGYFYPGIPSALFGIGWGVKMILLERLLLSIRPIAPNLVGPAYGNQLYIRFRWDVSGGIGVVW